jgi:hypothetical protein
VTTRLSNDERSRLATALAAVCRQAGIDDAGAVLIRYTMNAVYRLDGAQVVVRMTTGPTAAARTARVAQVASAFAERSLPTVRLAPGIAQPVHADGWSATVWTLLPQQHGHRFAPVDLANPLRAIHSVGELPVDLPAWDPVAKSRRRLSQIDALPGEAQRYLQDWSVAQVGLPLGKVTGWLGQRCEELTDAMGGAEWTLPWSVIHGDAHAGNLLRDTDGGVVICDFDSVAVGPPEWDLTPAAHGAARFADDHRQYQAFANAYGLDVTACPAWDTLRQIRELQLLTSVIADLPGRPDVANELAHRLRSGLSGEKSIPWHRYQ